MAVMVVLTGLVYVIARNTIETEINNSNLLLLENIRDNIDMALAEINDFSMEIFASGEIQDISIVSEEDPAFYYKQYKAAQSLSNYKTFKNPFQGYYVYLGGVNKVMRPGFVNFASLYYDAYLQHPDFEYERWLEAVNRRYFGNYILLPWNDSITDRNIDLALIRSLPLTSRSNAVTNIVIMLNFNRILDNGWQERGIAVLDSANNILAQSGLPSGFKTEGLPAMPENNGIFTRRAAGGGKEIVSYIASRENNWKYITVMPEYIFLEKASFIRLIMWGEILLCVIGMGALSFYFVRRNYNILHEITSFIRATLQSEAICRGNEYSYIRQVLTQSVEEQQEEDSRMDQKINALRSNLLIGLMEGYEMSVPLDELLTSYNVQFPYPYYSVAAVYIEQVNSELWGGQDKNEYAYAKAAVMNVMEEILNRKNKTYVVDFRDHILCIINTPFAWPEFRKSLEEDLKGAKDFIAQDFDIELYIAAGRLYSSVEDIHHAYNEAQSSIDYVRILGQGKTLFFGESVRSPGLGVYPFEKERFLLNNLRLSNFDAVQDVVDDIFCSDLLKPSVPQETVRFIVFALVSNVLRSICADEEEMNRQLRNEAWIEQLTNCKTIMEMKEPVLRMLKSAMESEFATHGGRKNQLSAMVQDYVKHHYAEPLLSIGSIAEAVGKSPYYVSKIFKMETGSGILDFINKVRIDKAKVLLRDTNFTQEQIADQVGLTSVRTYQRVFKKVEGVTPGQFKQTDTRCDNIPTNTP
jgi:AraC-like DNA-binding protein